MGKLVVAFGVVVVGLASILGTCVGDKDIQRQQGSISVSAPVFSSSVDSIPVSISESGSSQQSVYAKRPGSFVHSSASASAGGGPSSSYSDQISSGGSVGVSSSSGGGRHNTQGYAPTSALSFDFGGGSSGGYGSSHTSSSTGGSGWYEQPPPTASHQSPSPSPPSHAAASSTSVDNSYAPPGGPQGPSYTYYYQHYPTSSSSHSSGGWSNGDDGGGHSNIFGDLGGIGLPSLGGGFGGGGLGGIGGLKGVGVAALIAKGILAVKPFLILGLLLLIALPVLFLLLPIPIITITGQPGTIGRSGRSSQIASYLTQLSGKVLNAEECLERVICKLPQAPEKYQSRAKLVWDEYGSKLLKNERISRGLNAYFEGSTQKNKNLKCEQRFKCSNKYL